MEFLLTRPAVVALAILGAALSSVASFLQTRGRISEKSARVLNYAGYGCMGVSMLFFALAGLWR
ncbi:MAG: hypothetical protein E6H44_04760 [Betaproteobacteria bacterium]|nr:MAG: hypothetical protein E6H44_04760 [Betaproteobacteria bacterium]